MATQLQDLQAKRKELQATNPNATMLDAKSALSPIANAPIAGQAPAPLPTEPIAPVTPSPIDNKQVLANNQAKVQAEIQAGTRPEVGQQATPEQAPKIVEQAQQATAQANTLESDTKAKNEAQMALNKHKSELKQAETDKANANKTAEAQQAKQEAEQQLANNESAILTTLKTGGIVPESVKTSPYYKTAQQTYNKLLQYSNYSTGELVTAMNQGAILPGTTVYNEMMKDPAMKAKLTNANIYRTGEPVNTVQVYENASSDIMANNPTTSNYLSDGVITQEEYAQATNNKEVVAKAKEVEEKANRYNVLKAEYDEIENQVNEQFPGSPFRDAIMADRQKSKYKNLVLAKGEWETATGTLTELKSQSASLFETNLKLYESRRAEENQIASEQRQIQTQKDMMQYESDFEKQQAQEMMNDPTLAIPALIETYTKMGVPMQRSTQAIIQEAQNVIANGGNLADYMTELQGKIQSKPEYKRIQELQQGQLTDREKMDLGYAQDIGKIKLQDALSQAKNIASNKLTKLDDGLYQDESGNTYTADEIKQSKLFNNTYLTKEVGQEGGECGFYASRGTGMTSTPGGNSKEERVKAFSDTTPQVGGMAFFGGPGYDKTYGHISIITGVNQDGTINVKDSNYSGDKTVQERTVPASTATGFYNNTPLANSVNGETQATGTLSGQYTDEQVNNLAYLVELQEKNPSEASKQMKEMGYKAQDMANFKAGNVPLTEKQKNSSTDVMTAIADLADSTKYEWNDAVGFLAGTPSLSGGDAATATMAIDNLVAKMTLPNLGVLKGPMSDKDIAFIKDASSKLSRDQSDVSFEKNLIDAYNIAARRAGKHEITKLSDISGTKQKPTVGGEMDYSKYEPN